MNIFRNDKCKTAVNIAFIICVFIIIALGIYWRVHFYLMNNPLRWDEMSLALSFFDRNIFEMFLHLEENQKAPPLFCAAVWLIKYFWRGEELTYCFRLLPLLSGIASLFAFYFLSKKLLKSKFSILLSMWLFAQSVVLIYYAQEFKPYSCDVLVCISILLLYKRISFKSITFLKSIAYSVLIAFLMLFSFPCLFIVPAVILLKMTEEKVLNKNIFVIPVGYIISLLYLYILYKENYQNELGEEEWQRGFLNFSFSQNFNLISDFVGFFYNWDIGSLLVAFLFVLFICGIILLLMSKKSEAYLILIIISFAVIASFCHIYPLSSRMMLYFVPFIILAFAKFADIDNIKTDSNTIKTFCLIFLCNGILWQAGCYNFWLLNRDKDSLIYWQSNYFRYQVKELISDMCTKMSAGDKLYSQYELGVYSKWYSFSKYGYLKFEHTEMIDSPDKDEILNGLDLLIEQTNKQQNLYMLLKKETYESDSTDDVSIYNYTETFLNNKALSFEKIENDLFVLYEISK